MSNLNALPSGSTVLITGINGFIASKIADHVLGAGFKVRGTARSAEKATPVVDALEKKHGSGKVDFIVIEDMGAKNAFHGSLEGCAGIVHVASDTTFDKDPNNVIPVTVDGVKNVMAAAAAVPTIKRFVYTSSLVAAVKIKPNLAYHVNASSWNDEVVEAAGAPPPYTDERRMINYAASKVQGERACFEFMRTEKPSFVFNSVVASFVMGSLVDPSIKSMSPRMVRELYEQKDEGVAFMKNNTPLPMINVDDLAKLHLAALVDSTWENERFLAYAESFDNNSLLAIFRELDPSVAWPEDIKDMGKDISTIDNASSIEALKRMGQPQGFIGLKQSALENIGRA